MYCIKCGRYMEGDEKICSECKGGTEGASEFVIYKEVKQGNKNLLGIVGIVFGVLIVLGISIGAIIKNRNKGTESLPQKDNVTITKQEKKEEYNGVKNEYGNSFNNLGFHCVNVATCGYTGRVTSQGGTTYFYEKNAICSIDANGEITQICNAQNASSLNVMGNTLYYLEGEKVYSVNINGGSRTELLINVCGPFFVWDDSIIYVTQSNMTATRQEYYICRYFIDKQEPQQTISTGETFPTIIGKGKSDSVMFGYETQSYVEETGWSYTNNYERYAIIDCDFEGNIISENIYMASEPSKKGDFYPFLAKDYLFIMYTFEDSYYCMNTDIYSVNENYEMNREHSYNFKTYMNCWGNDIVYEYAKTLCLEKIIQSEYSCKDIISENYPIFEFYVVGDYVYYTIEDSYREAELYRVKIDGTDWEDIGNGKVTRDEIPVVNTDITEDVPSHKSDDHGKGSSLDDLFSTIDWGELY